MRYVTDVVTGHRHVRNVTGNLKCKTWLEIPPGNYLLLCCCFCQYTIKIGKGVSGCDKLRFNKSEDGREFVDHGIRQEAILGIPHFKNFRNSHLKQCTLQRKIAGNEWEKRQYDRSGKFHLNAHWPPLFQYKVSHDIDSTQTKLPNGKVNWAAYRESSQRRMKRKMLEDVRQQVEEEHKKREQQKWYCYYQEQELDKILKEHNQEYRERLKTKLETEIRTQLIWKHDEEKQKIKSEMKQKHEQDCKKLEMEYKSKIEVLESENRDLKKKLEENLRKTG